MEGCSDAVSPSKISFQSVGDSGVTTSWPHPQQHKCPAVLYGSEMYNTPLCIGVGKLSTNSWETRSILDIHGFFHEQLIAEGIDAVEFLPLIVVEADVLLPPDHRQGGVHRIELRDLDVGVVHAAIVGSQRDVTLEGRTVSGRAEGGAHLAVEARFRRLDPPAHLDGGDPLRFEVLRDDALQLRLVDGDEDEGHVIELGEQLDIHRSEERRVGKECRSRW